MLIAQISDLHVGGADVAAYYRLDTRAMLEAAVARINALSMRPALCLVTGDIVENGTAEEYRLARTELDRLAMPWCALPGNHDVRAPMRAVFSDRVPVDEKNEFLHYAIEDFPLRILMLDSVVPGSTHGKLCAARSEWLRTQLSGEREKPTLLAMHHPPFATRQPTVDRVCLAHAGDFAALVSCFPQVEAIISGHVHRSICSRVAQAAASSCPSTAHQMMLALRESDPMAFTHEPPGFQLHWWDGPGTWTTHTIHIGQFDGPFAFH
jgi:3',5'-cyclic AMP phosphodiesterase CpdA